METNFVKKRSILITIPFLFILVLILSQNTVSGEPSVEMTIEEENVVLDTFNKPNNEAFNTIINELYYKSKSLSEVK